MSARAVFDRAFGDGWHGRPKAERSGLYARVFSSGAAARARADHGGEVVEVSRGDRRRGRSS